MNWDFRRLLVVFQCHILRYLMQAKIASALNKIINNSQFKRKISLEKQKQKEGRFLRGKQIAYLIYEQFRVTGTDDSVENYTDLFTIVLRNDDSQEFYSKWDGILLSMTKIPPDDILERLYTLKIREFQKLKTVLELYVLETHQKKLVPDYRKLKIMVKRNIEQEIRNKSFGAKNGNFEKNAVIKNQGTRDSVYKEFLEKNCWQWEFNGHCVNGVNCSFRHDMDKRGKSSSSNRFQKSFMQQSERKPSRTRSPRGNSPSGGMSRWPCKDYLKGTCNNSFVKNGNLQNACSTKTRMIAVLGKNAHSHIVRLSHSRRNGPNRIMTKALWLSWKRVIGMNENLLLTEVTIDQGNLIRGVIKSWDKSHLNVDHPIHDNWVAYFTTWRRRNLFFGGAPIQRVKIKKAIARHTKIRIIPRSVTFVQVNLISVVPMLQNLRIVHKKRQSSKNKVSAKQRCNAFFSPARHLESQRERVGSVIKCAWQGWEQRNCETHSKLLWVRTRRDSRSPTAIDKATHRNLTLQRQQQRQKKKVRLPELFDYCSHEDPSPLWTSTSVTKTEGIVRYECIEVPTPPLAKLPPLAGSAGALSFWVASLKHFTVSVFVQNSNCIPQWLRESVPARGQDFALTHYVLKRRSQSPSHSRSAA